MSAARPLALFRNAAHGPAPTRQFARYRDVGHARLLVGSVHHALPIDRLLHVGIGAASRIGWGGLACGCLLRSPYCRLVAPRGLDQKFPQMLDIGHGDAVAH